MNRKLKRLHRKADRLGRKQLKCLEEVQSMERDRGKGISIPRDQAKRKLDELTRWQMKIDINRAKITYLEFINR
jgi:hypothetical protein